MTKHKPHHDDRPATAAPTLRPVKASLPMRSAIMRPRNRPTCLEQLRTDLEGAKDRVLRSQAELENYRKRAAREIDEHRRYANLPLLSDLLPVLDNIERAVAAADKTHDAASLWRGSRWCCSSSTACCSATIAVRIDALHQPFNPHLHEAISQQPSDEFPPHTVLFVVRARLSTVRPRGAAEPGDCFDR